MLAFEAAAGLAVHDQVRDCKWFTHDAVSADQDTVLAVITYRIFTETLETVYRT